METKIKPWGVVLEVTHNDRKYYGLIQNDFEKFKTYGNEDLPTDTLIILDHTMTPLNFSVNGTRELYNEIEELIKKVVVRGKSEDIGMIDVVVLFRDGEPKGFMTEEKFKRLTVSPPWWDSKRHIQIPEDKWEYTHIGNIKRFL